MDGGAASAEEAAVHGVEEPIRPVLDESPTGDPEVSASLAAERGDPEQAAADAEWDAAGDPDLDPQG